MTWQLLIDQLLGRPAPALPELPGRVHTARDEPIDPKYLVGITSSAEIGLLLGVSRQTAWARLQARKDDEAKKP